MMEGWKYINLGDIIHIKHGYGFKGKYFVEEPNHNLLLTPGNFAIGGGFKSDKMKYYEGPINDEFVLHAGDVIVTMTDLSMKADTLGYSAKIPNIPENTYLHNQRLGLVSLKTNEFDLDYIYWLLRTYNYQKYIAGSSSGATVKHTSPKKIYSAKLLVPESKVTQKRIADILSAYDDLIENNLKRIKLLEQAAQNIYKEWFVHLRFPGYENTPINEDTGLPEGWEEVLMEDVMNVSGGGTPSTKEPLYWEEGKVLWFSPTDLNKNNSLVLMDSTKKITELGLKKSSAKLLPQRTILMSSRATIGLFGLFNGECSTNQGFININPKEESLRYYILFNLKSRVEELISNASGATFKELSKRVFKRMSIVSPDTNISTKFYNQVELFINQTENLEFQNQKLKAARDILLPRLMNRTIEV